MGEGNALLEPGISATVRPILDTHEERLAGTVQPNSGPGSVTILIPMLNECAGLDALMARLAPVLASIPEKAEILFVDDGSTDGTRAKVKALRAADPRIRSIHLSRNFGKERAIAAGLMRTTGDAVIIIDADLQNPPESIPEFLANWRAGYDVVYGIRKARNTDTPVRRWLTLVFYALFNYVSGTRLPEGAGDFRLLSRKAVEAMNQLGERERFNKGLFSWIGFRSVGVPYSHDERSVGSSKWSIRRLTSFAFDGIAAFSIMPLRLASAMGFATSFAALAYATYFLVQTWIFGADVPGFPSLIISIMFFSGVQLISLGLLGEYLGRVYEEVKGRPLVIIDELVGFDAEPLRTPPAIAPAERESGPL